MHSSWSGHTYSRGRDGHYQEWEARTLWEAAKGLPVELVRIEDLPEVLTDSWVKNWDDPNDPLVKCEAERTATADLAYPVILHPDGELMDGYHRVCKALQLGFTHVQAVRLTYQTLPSPDNDWA